MEVFILSNWYDGSIHLYTSAAEAHAAAITIVGNRATITTPNGWLYGPGDGTASVMIQRTSRELAMRFFPRLFEADNPIA